MPRRADRPWGDARAEAFRGRAGSATVVRSVRQVRKYGGVAWSVGGRREQVPLTDRDVLRLSGFPVDHARVLAVAFADAVGAALIDTNGDGSCVELEFLQHDRTAGWLDAGGCSAGSYGHGGGGAHCWAYGYLPTAAAAFVEVAGRVETVPVNEHGWWLYVVSLSEHEAPPQQAGVKFPDVQGVGDARIAG